MTLCKTFFYVNLQKLQKYLLFNWIEELRVKYFKELIQKKTAEYIMQYLPSIILAYGR